MLESMIVTGDRQRETFTPLPASPRKNAAPLRHDALGQVAGVLLQPGGAQHLNAGRRVFGANEGLQRLQFLQTTICSLWSACYSVSLL